MRRKSKSEYRVEVDKADYALQCFYRVEYPKEKCESCGRKFDLMHHWREKSRCAYLRFPRQEDINRAKPLNLIFLCKKCHALHHQFGDSSVHDRILLKRGEVWLKQLDLESRKHLSLTVKYAKEIQEKYKIV